MRRVVVRCVVARRVVERRGVVERSRRVVSVHVLAVVEHGASRCSTSTAFVLCGV